MVLELEASSAQIQRILQSKAFRTSEVHRNLLTYLAEKSLAGESDSLKEYTVGLDVFAKPSSYDPRQESTVRMHVARLRQKLSEYYRTEGVEDAIFVDLPKGGFRVTFEPRAAAVVPEPEAAAILPLVSDSKRYWFEIVLVAALLVAVGSALYFGTRLWQTQRADANPAGWTPELRQLWDPIITSSRPLIVAVSTARPQVTAGATASGVFRLGEFLGALKTSVQVLRSDQIEAPEVAMGNVVFLGPMVENRQMQAMTEGRPFVLEAAGIRNVQPLAGEPAVFTDRPPADPQDTEESYALISRVPGLYKNGEVLYLSGNRVGSVTGGVQAFTDPAIAHTLVTRMKDAAGNLPRYYQVVVKVRSMDDMPIDITYVVHRALPAPDRSKSSK
ncbi:MAG: hypothetical protein ABI995_06700 [Acidobacteriota bacterium]